jgi:hypothetical protein
VFIGCDWDEWVADQWNGTVQWLSGLGDHNTRIHWLCLG